GLGHAAACPYVLPPLVHITNYRQAGSLPHGLGHAAACPYVLPPMVHITNYRQAGSLPHGSGHAAACPYLLPPRVHITNYRQAGSLPHGLGHADACPYGAAGMFALYPKVRTMPSRSFFQCDRNLWAALPGAYSGRMLRMCATVRRALLTWLVFQIW